MSEANHHEKAITAEQGTTLVESRQGKAANTITEIVKKVPQLTLMAAMTFGAAAPDTYNNIPGHAG